MLGDREHRLEELGIDEESGDFGERKGVPELEWFAVGGDEREWNSNADTRVDERDVFLRRY